MTKNIINIVKNSERIPLMLGSYFKKSKSKWKKIWEWLRKLEVSRQQIG